MYKEYLIKELQEQVELLQAVVSILVVLLSIFFVRNLYNLIRKRSYRKKHTELVQDKMITDTRLDEQQGMIQFLEKNYQAEKNKLELMKSEFAEQLVNLKKAKTAIEIRLKEQSELGDYQRKALEKFADYKSIDANNTRLGAHFIKNVISHVYQNLEMAQEGSTTIFGFSRPTNGNQGVSLSIEALKNMFILLDYNVSAVHKENVTVGEEIVHLEKFIELLKFLKPKAKISLNMELGDQIIKNLKIKPTLFFPFLENALKHGNLNDVNSFINLKISCFNSNQLSYQVENSCETVAENEVPNNTKTPFGLTALKKLIQTYYPNNTLTHQIDGVDRYVAYLKLTI